MPRLKIVFFIALALNLKAQVFNFRAYTQENGLCQSYIYSISQTKKGLLHIATGEGFSEFDGKLFKNYTVKDGLAENFVTAEFSDSRGVTWLGHFQEGISYSVPKGFRPLKDSTIPFSRINQFCESPKRTVWAAMANGLVEIDSAFKVVRFIELPSVNAICFDNSGSLLCATNEGLFAVRPDNTVSALPGFSYKKITHLIPDNYAHTVFWAAVEGEGLSAIHKTTTGYSSFLRINAVSSADTKISALYKDKSGNLWLALFKEGLRKISFQGSDKYNYHITSISASNGLPGDYILSIFQDFEGNMWFGSFGDGLILKLVERFSFFNKSNGIADENCKAIVTDALGTAWIGTASGLSCLSPSGGKPVSYNASNGFTDDQVNALYIDNNQVLWIGTASKGTYTCSVISPARTFHSVHGLDMTDIKCITSSGAKIAIAAEGGLYFFDRGKRSVEKLTTMEGLLHNSIRHLFEDSKKRLWISSHGTPPYFYRDGRFEAFNTIPGLKSFEINAACEDRDGVVWIATEGDGLFRYDGKSWTSYKTTNGLLSDYCYGIISGSDNSVWVTHKNGLSEKKYGSTAFKGFSQADGLLSVENNFAAVCRDREGNIWFGTTTGIIVNNVDAEKLGKVEPKIFISNISFNKEVLSAAHPIEKSYANYLVQINFTGVSFTDPDKVVYKYRLLGLDTAWHVTVNRSMEYPKLNDGHYIFQVQACNADGTWNKTPAEARFTIHKPYWKQWWFMILALAALALLVYALIFWRTLALQKAKAFLERRITEKTMLLQREKEKVESIKVELEEKNKNITDSINYAKRIQEALLPSKKAIIEKLPGSFIFYRPRDIVSGDFYWFHETEDWYIIAAVDCTGHGVPGAFMSMIGSILINEIVENERIEKPAEILHHLNDRIVHRLHQEQHDVSSYDGMDMAILKINKKKNECIFSGAPRPLYIVRNGEFIEYKGGAFSIGGDDNSTPKIFKEHNLAVYEGDMLYMFSDGYADQFNPRTNKKFTTKRFKNLLCEVACKKGEEQQQDVENAFLEWKGGGEQIDDILVMGIRV